MFLELPKVSQNGGIAATFALEVMSALGQKRKLTVVWRSGGYLVATRDLMPAGLEFSCNDLALKLGDFGALWPRKMKSDNRLL